MSKQPHNQRFIESYSEEFDFIRKSREGEHFALCIACNTHIKIKSGGRSDIVAYANTKKHKEKHKNFRQTSKLQFSAVPSSDFQPIKAEVLFTNFLIEHNVPIAAADHASKLFSAIFPNSAEVKKFSCGRTKAGHIIREIASDSTKKISEVLRNGAFSIATDGSNDTEIQMYPLVVSFFDENVGHIVSKLLSLPYLEDADSTGANIADLIIKEFERLDIPFKNCLSIGFDNANVMIGKK